jgi:CRP-like cAMP-binding protein
MRINLLDQLDKLAVSMPVPRGSLLFRSGEPASAVYIVRTGKIVLVWMAPDHVYPMDTVGPGSIVGLAAALNGEYCVTAKAVEDSDLGYIAAREAISMLESSPRLAFAAMKLTVREALRMQTTAEFGAIHSAEAWTRRNRTAVLPGRPDGM